MSRRAIKLQMRQVIADKSGNSCRELFRRAYCIEEGRDNIHTLGMTIGSDMTIEDRR